MDNPYSGVFLLLFLIILATVILIPGIVLTVGK